MEIPNWKVSLHESGKLIYLKDWDGHGWSMMDDMVEDKTDIIVDDMVDDIVEDMI